LILVTIITASEVRKQKDNMEVIKIGLTPETWPGLIGFPVLDAVNIIRQERPDITEVRVLPPNEAPSPLVEGTVRVCIYNDIINGQAVVVTPDPYIG
jgi:hypothetical protein